jgi:hypothetical protein
VTNGFRSNWGRDLFAAVRSVVNTGKRHGFNAFEAIIKALSSALPDFLFKPGGAITSHLCKVYRSSVSFTGPFSPNISKTQVRSFMLLNIQSIVDREYGTEIALS